MSLPFIKNPGDVLVDFMLKGLERMMTNEDIMNRRGFLFSTIKPTIEPTNNWRWVAADGDD